MHRQDIEIAELNLREKIRIEKQLEPLYTELVQVASRKAMVAFDALTRQGFTRHEAMDILLDAAIFPSSLMYPYDDDNPQQ